jgi:hypothetical protein
MNIAENQYCPATFNEILPYRFSTDLTERRTGYVEKGIYAHV